MPKFYDQLSEASLENLASDPSNLPEGRIWLNTTSGLVKQVIGGVVKVVATADNTLTFTNKSISGATNTITAVPAANVVNTPSGNLAATDVQAALNELQSDIDTRATSSALTAHTSATTSVHGIADTADLLTTANAKVVTNKDIDGGTASNTSRFTIPKDTLANLQSLTRKEGTIVYATDTDKFYSDNGTSLVAVGTGSGAKNYLPDGDSEATNPFTMYADGAAVPVDGTGGSPTATITQSATSPLAGLKSFVFTSGGLGDGGAYAFTIDVADKLSMQTLEVSSDGLFAQDDLSVWLYDVTNSMLIAPQPTQYLSPRAGKQTLFFQLSNGTSFKFLIHQASANSFTAKFEVSLSAMPFAGYAPITTDPVSYTPTYTGLGTVTGSDVKYYQDGKHLCVEGSATIGTSTATPGKISLPTGLLMDVSQTSILVGEFQTDSDPSVTFILQLVAFPGTSTTEVFITRRYGPNNDTPLTLQNANSIIGAGYCSFKFKIPIQGWSSQSQVVSQYNGLTTVIKLTGDPASATSGNPIIFPTTEYNQNFSYNASTGELTINVNGKYQVSGSVDSPTAGGFYVYLWKNGSNTNDKLGGTSSNGFASISGSFEGVVGDVITFRPNTTMDVATGSFIQVSMLSGAQQIIAGQRISAEYHLSSNQALTANTTAVLFDAQDSNTGGITNSSGVFSVSNSGDYHIGHHENCNGSSTYFKLYKNGTLYKTIGFTGPGVISTGGFVIPLLNTDTFEIRAASSFTISGGVLSSDQTAWITIKQVN